MTLKFGEDTKETFEAENVVVKGLCSEDAVGAALCFEASSAAEPAGAEQALIKAASAYRGSSAEDCPEHSGSERGSAAVDGAEEEEGR